MQATYKFPLVLAVGFALGASAIQALHAQAKPPGYLLAEVAVTVDEATYKDSEFMKQTVPSIKTAGAKDLAGGFNNATALSGASPANRIVLLQFEFIDKAKAWYADGQAERENLAAKSPRASASWRSRASTSKDKLATNSRRWASAQRLFCKGSRGPFAARREPQRHPGHTRFPRR